MAAWSAATRHARGRAVAVREGWSPACGSCWPVDFVSDDPAYAGTMTMTWEVTAVDAGARVDIRADNVPDGISADDHAAGLTSTLAKLAAYLEQ